MVETVGEPRLQYVSRPWTSWRSSRRPRPPLEPLTVCLSVCSGEEWRLLPV